VIGVSPGAIGTAVGQQHLRSILGFLNSPQMNSPEAYIHFKDGMINDAGEIGDASTAKFLGNYLEEFHNFISRVLTVSPRGA
jgi:chromate reductase